MTLRARLAALADRVGHRDKQMAPAPWSVSSYYRAKGHGNGEFVHDIECKSGAVCQYVTQDNAIGIAGVRNIMSEIGGLLREAAGQISCGGKGCGTDPDTACLRCCRIMLHNSEANHGAYCDKEQQRLRELADKALRENENLRKLQASVTEKLIQSYEQEVAALANQLREALDLASEGFGYMNLSNGDSKQAQMVICRPFPGDQLHRIAEMHHELSDLYSKYLDTESKENRRK